VRAPAPVLLALLALAPVLALAQAGADCKPDGNQQQLNACAVRDFQAADIQLNIRYAEVMDGLPTGRRTALRQQQRGWLKSRDARCKTEVRSSEGGSAWPLFFYACLEKATKARSAELDRWARGDTP